MMTTAWSNGDAMIQLAKQTGGRFFENSNDLFKGVERAFADGREEYVLAYVSNNTSADGQFRKISVEVKDKNLKIAAKAGYWP
jgi:VWFA-related protein